MQLMISACEARRLWTSLDGYYLGQENCWCYKPDIDSKIVHGVAL
jgi:hypothetical protein